MGSGTGLYGLKPDMLTLAKGITSAYFPVSASVISKRVWDVMEKASPEYGPVMHGFTYSGHPVGAAIGLANIAILKPKPWSTTPPRWVAICCEAFVSGSVAIPMSAKSGARA